ncbi:MAG: hypothetical protein J5I91_00105 [Bacteroidetes bacterium]|nr:hypothetical protein [Bacteroidota bacterium]
MTRLFKLPNYWGIICLFNLFVASILGVIMRYKINFPLPGITQANLLHAHSHFVFQGWATLTLMTAFISLILPNNIKRTFAYFAIFWLSVILSWGVLISFSLQGYSVVSIGFMTAAQVVFYWFAIQFMIDLKRIEAHRVVKYFAVVSIISYIIASIGEYYSAAFSLYGPSTPLVTRGAMYFYLHFQYNGWFSFAIITLFFRWLTTNKIKYSHPSLLKVFILFSVGLIPGYCLSLIGYVDELWVYICSYFAIITQVIGVVILTKMIYRARVDISNSLSLFSKFLWGIAFLSIIAKTGMQIASLQPSLAIVAFSLRPLVIGYLHLVFICFVSFFLFGYMIEKEKISFKSSSPARSGIIAFFVFSIISELLLFLQAAGNYFYFHVPHISLIIYYITVVMSASLLIFVIGQIRKYSKF